MSAGARSRWLESVLKFIKREEGEEGGKRGKERGRERRGKERGRERRGEIDR